MRFFSSVLRSSCMLYCIRKSASYTPSHHGEKRTQTTRVSNLRGPQNIKLGYSERRTNVELSSKGFQVPLIIRLSKVNEVGINALSGEDDGNSIVRFFCKAVSNQVVSNKVLSSAKTEGISLHSHNDGENGCSIVDTNLPEKSEISSNYRTIEIKLIQTVYASVDNEDTDFLNLERIAKHVEQGFLSRGETDFTVILQQRPAFKMTNDVRVLENFSDSPSFSPSSSQDNVLSTVMDGVSISEEASDSPPRSNSLLNSENQSESVTKENIQPTGPSVTILATIAGVAGMTLVCIVISVYMCHRHYSSGSKYKRDSLPTSSDTPSSRRRNEQILKHIPKPPMSVVNIDQNDNRSIDDTTLGLHTAGRNPGPPVKNIITSNMTYVSGLDTADVVKELRAPVPKHKRSVASASAETDGSSYNFSTNSKSLTVPTLLQRDKVGLGLHMDCEDTLEPESIPSVASPNDDFPYGAANKSSKPGFHFQETAFRDLSFHQSENSAKDKFNVISALHVSADGQAPANDKSVFFEPNNVIVDRNNFAIRSKEPRFREEQHIGKKVARAIKPPVTDNSKSHQNMVKNSDVSDIRSPPIISVSSETENDKTSNNSIREKYETMTAPSNSFGKKYNPWSHPKTELERGNAKNNPTKPGPWSFEATERVNGESQAHETDMASKLVDESKMLSESHNPKHSPSSIIDIENAPKEELPQSSQYSAGEESSSSAGEEHPWLLSAVEDTLGPRTMSADMESLGDKSRPSLSNKSSHSKSSNGMHSYINSPNSRKSGSSVGSRRSSNSLASSAQISIANELQRLEAQLASLNSKKDSKDEGLNGSVGSGSLDRRSVASSASNSKQIQSGRSSPSPHRCRVPKSSPARITANQHAQSTLSPSQNHTKDSIPRTDQLGRSSPSPMRRRSEDGRLVSGRTSPSSRHSRESGGSHRSHRSVASNVSKESRTVANDLMRLEAQLAQLNKTKHREAGTSDNSCNISKSTEISRASYISQRRISLVAPPGKVGIILMNRTDKKGTVVAEVRNTSPLFGKIFDGDKIVQVDGIDVSRTSVSEITALMTSKADCNRVLSVVTSRMPEAPAKKKETLKV